MKDIKNERDYMGFVQEIAKTIDELYDEGNGDYGDDIHFIIYEEIDNALTYYYTQRCVIMYSDNLDAIDDGMGLDRDMTGTDAVAKIAFEALKEDVEQVMYGR